MLVLTRKIDQEIIIDGDIRISVLEIRGNRVKLGVEAPQSVSIQRPEAMATTADHGELWDVAMAAGI